MKSLPLLLLCFSPAWLASAQEFSPSELPSLEILPQDILSSHTVHDGIRDLTLQKLDPAAMEDQRLSLPPAVLFRSAPPVAEMEPPEEPADNRPVHTLILGASVHIADESHPEQAVTRLQFWNNGRDVSFWIPANALWLSGHGEVTTDAARFHLLLAVSQVSGDSTAPAFSSLPPGGFVVAEGEPSQEETAAVRALLDFYQRDTQLLRTQYEARRAQAAAAEAERAANPPEKRPVIMHYWRADEAAIRAAREGGVR